MEKTLLEPSQVESHQPHLGSAVRLRHGESRTLANVGIVKVFGAVGGNRSSVCDADQKFLEEGLLRP